MKCKDCTVYYCQYRTTDAEKDCYYEQWEQWTAKEFDWQYFRAEATKDILCHLLNDRYSGDGDNHSLVMQAIGITDELVKQLKEKEEG